MTKKLDKYEKDLLEHFDAGKLKTVKNIKKESKIAIAASSNFLKKNEKITIRLSHFDLEQIRRKAAEEGLSYQSLVSSILHKFVTGRLVNRNNQ